MVCYTTSHIQVKKNYQSVKNWQSALYFSKDLIQARCSSVFPKQHCVIAFTARLSASHVNGGNQVWPSVQFLYPSPLRGLACYLSTGTGTLQNHHVVASTVVFSLCLKSSGLMLWTESLALGSYGHENEKKRGRSIGGGFCSNVSRKW